MILPEKIKFTVENYMHHANDRNAIKDTMILCLLMQVSRFLCWHRVKFEGEKGLEFPMVFGFNFAPSGAYKDAVIKTVENVILQPLDIQSEIKKNNFIKQNDLFNVGLEYKTGEVKKQYIEENKVQKFKNTMSSGTDVGFQKRRKGAENAGIGHIHYEQSEFGDSYSKKDSNVDQILSMAKSAWDHGNTKSETLSGEYRDDVVGVPLTFLLHGSATALSSDHKVLKRFIDILKTGIAKRCFILFNNKYKRINRTYEEECLDSGAVLRSKPIVEKYFMDMFNKIKVTGEYLAYNYKTIKVDDETKKLKNMYKNECNDKANKINNEIIQIEMRDRFWRAFRLACCIAVFEHPEDLTIKLEDYSLAIELTDKWGEQFKSFLTNDEAKTKSEIAYEYLLDNPKTGTTKLGKVVSCKYASERASIIKDIKLIADENNMVLIEEKKGAATYYSIVKPEMPSDSLITTNEFSKLITNAKL